MTLRQSPWKNISLIISFFLLLFLLSVFGFYFILNPLILNPLYFLKSVTIQPADDILRLIDIESAKTLDIAPLLRQIPYKGGFVHAMLPKNRYQKTIVDGGGDCSDLSYGLAYYLTKHGHEYIIIHFIKTDEFLENGHVALQTSYRIEGKNYMGIVDVLEGGLPATKNGFVSLRDFFTDSPGNISIFALNSSKDNSSDRYTTDFLGKTVIGIMLSKEVKKYFKFLSSIYIPLGNKRVEEGVYLAISILAGQYPTIYVSKNDYHTLFKKRGLIKLLSGIMLWMTRISLFIVPPLLVIYGYLKVKKGMGKRSG